ncbi:hypothetical protein GOV12_01280 [Candidatus Pacearchaeota archaeon]|nr:hypothetical protein [Candidatus Pacearchaeota archaeon]
MTRIRKVTVLDGILDKNIVPQKVIIDDCQWTIEVPLESKSPLLRRFLEISLDREIYVREHSKREFHHGTLLEVNGDTYTFCYQNNPSIPETRNIRDIKKAYVMKKPKNTSH